MQYKKSYCTNLLTVFGLKIDQDFRFSDADFANFTDYLIGNCLQFWNWAMCLSLFSA